MQQILSSDVMLVSFSLLLGALIGMYWERVRNERKNKASGNGETLSDKR